MKIQFNSIKSRFILYPLFVFGFLNTGYSQDNSKQFTLLNSGHTGIDFSNEVPSYDKMNVLVSQYHYNGGGVAIGDLNNDGLPEVFFNSNFGPNKLYLNKGDMKFEDITAKSGLQGQRAWETGVNMVDINNDGFLDIYICRSGHAPDTPFDNLLYINNGDLTFKEKSFDYSLFDVSHSTQSYFFDYDLDGDLDFYLLNHNPKRTWDYDFSKPEGTRDSKVGDKLYRNDNGIFVDVSDEAGIIGKSISYGLAALIGDLNNDSYPDIYICNDFGERDYMYLSTGDGGFKETLRENTDHISWYSMGGDIADYNNDGFLDLMVLDMTAEDNFRQKANMNSMNPEKFWYAVENGLHYQYMINTLQLNLGNGKFSEVGMMAGVSYTDWSWGPLFGDFNQDGYKDLYITNGYRVDISNKDYMKWFAKWKSDLDTKPLNQRDLNKELQVALNELNKTQIANYMYENNKDLTFKNVSKDWGLDQLSFSNGVAYGDLDADGDLDLVVSNLDHESFVYQNNSQTEKNSSIKVKLQGPSKNIMGIGAKLILETSAGTQVQEFYPTRGYLSSMEPIVHFGIGSSDPLSLKVVWYDGTYTTIENLSKNTTTSVSYENRSNSKLKNEVTPQIFKDVTAKLKIDFDHEENLYDDFEKEVLLPHKLSQFGPALAIADVDGDKDDDFYVGGAKDHAGALFIQNSDGTFSRSGQDFWNSQKSYEDIDAVFVDVDGDGDKDLYIVSGGNEFLDNDEFLEDRIYINSGKNKFKKAAEGTLPPLRISGGTVEASDYDKDGDIDLFVGGRIQPGKYPTPPRSVLLENNKGKFSDVTTKRAPMLEYAGMVTDSEWVDLDGDKDDDLVVTGEWMHPLILINTKGDFSEKKQNPSDIGWWFSVTSSDIDNDGDKDLVLGNLGLNYKYQASKQEPFHIYADDFDKSGSLDIVLGYDKNNVTYPVRGKQCSTEQMPFISEKFGTYSEFAASTIFDIYGEDNLESSLNYNATRFSSVLAINNGDGSFTWKDLPMLSQISPINDAVILDYDHDGNKDVFVAGNLFTSEVETPRADAGKGWLLKGSGSTELQAVHPSKTGIIADGDVKRLGTMELNNGVRIILVARNNGTLGAYSLN